jgi:hypothetical protein
MGKIIIGVALGYFIGYIRQQNKEINQKIKEIENDLKKENDCNKRYIGEF